jgi:hypothetical protein
MKDPQIREILRGTELAHYLADPNSKVVEEMKLPVAKARVDMAVINGSFHGYEIKSASDSLQRLPNQLVAYSLVFDRLTIVTEDKYCNKIMAIVPEWVRVCVCSEHGEITECQPSKINLNKNGFYLAKLLWNEELFQILANQKISFSKKDRNWLLCEALSMNVELCQLSDIVRDTLKKRENWKGLL